MSERSGIAGRNDRGCFNHQIFAFGGARAMDDALRDNEALLLSKFDASALKVDDEATFKNKEKLVVVIVFVPMIFPLHDAEANYRIIHSAQQLGCTSGRNTPPLARARRPAAATDTGR